MTKNSVNQEGFWKSKTEPHFPDAHEWSRFWGTPILRNRFITRLELVESHAKRRMYRGFSVCRICGEVNGAVTYEYKGWEWPEGYLHYIKIHNFKPTPDFLKFIVNASKELDKK